MGLNRQNAMFYDVLTALQRRKEAEKSIANDTRLLKKSNGGGPIGNDAEVGVECGIDGPGSDCLAPGETAVLRVDLKKCGGQVVLFKGQWIRTPMGNGKIISIQPKEEKIVLQLSFGKMYANLRRAVCWGKVSNNVQLLELSSDDVLLQRWTALQSSYSMSAEVTRGIHELVGQSDDEAVTDKDDDNSNDDTSPIDAIAEDASNSNGHQSNERQEALAVEGATAASSSPVPPGTEGSSTSTSCSFPLKGYLRSSSATAASVTGVLTATLSRPALKLLCSNSSSNVSHDLELCRTLPIVFSPPGECITLDSWTEQ